MGTRGYASAFLVASAMNIWGCGHQPEPDWERTPSTRTNLRTPEDDGGAETPSPPSASADSLGLDPGEAALMLDEGNRPERTETPAPTGLDPAEVFWFSIRRAESVPTLVDVLRVSHDEDNSTVIDGVRPATGEQIRIRLVPEHNCWYALSSPVPNVGDRVVFLLAPNPNPRGESMPNYDSMTSSFTILRVDGAYAMSPVGPIEITTLEREGTTE